MPALREIRQRIKATKNMAKITQAKQMVASSKLRRAQERVEEARPYADQLRALVSRLAGTGGDDLDSELALLKQRPVRNVGIIHITPDRGLCGALPSNLNRYAALMVQQQLEKLQEQERHAGVSYIAVGRKGRDFILRTGQSLLAEFVNYGDRPTMSDASAIAQVAVDAFLKGEVDVVHLIYAKFVNTVTQQPTAIQLLPVQSPAESGQKHENSEYIYEPNPREIFQALLPRYVDVQVYQALLEAVASEQSASMVAMKNATDSANELVQDLTLTYNKARQAAITTQILEVVSGAEAL
jgi:F-type H+-transporting ATPase subunit gamma